MIILKSPEELKKMRKSCQIVAKVLKELKTYIKEGLTTKQIEQFVENLIIKMGGIPAFKGYRGYPASVCISINEQVVHGIPSEKVFIKEGDLVSVDVGVLCEHFYGDAAYTYPIGKISKEAEKLLKITEEALYKGIAEAMEGKRIGDISHAIQMHVENNGFSVVRAFVGHGIGRSLHEEPQIPNFGTKGIGPMLKKGMTLAIEPMVNTGKHDVKILSDGWTAVTKDGSLSAHFEHTIAITEGEPEILTKL
ncbi:type I methionyl aminopeptidase [Thermodesulfovibrio yellowstonii]|uniref:Methionine aminopeptidase n=2 Tax=Thermodesulfovibrio yellowstonii TaxID=28262 RepID=B5YG27_THEYD|nr:MULTISPECIES: type I methionyl aminopeptidase [Thermodesulfovibrio]ACI20641.1 methionine aminopeptidase, type I [Thermodesulfovibrio yellowstonii DSM 11347]MDI6865942.1 type I methionyl aminopeptidase [Thermodesulfovibrio yellowstonii]GLI53184.1 methionine aminopeptidase [Thermodesulfovibrio islandicus]